jgi:hypothetical protein
MTDRESEASAIYLVGHGSFREPRLIELQYRRIIRYMETLDGKSGGSPDIFMDLNIRRSGELQNLSVLRKHMSDYARIFIDIEDSASDSVLQFVCEELAGGPKILNVFYDEGRVLDSRLKEIGGEKARADDLNDGSDFTCFFPSLTADILQEALREELNTGDCSSVEKRIDSLRHLKPYHGGGKQPFIEDRLRLKWKRPR